MTTVITRGAGSAQALGYAARATAANYIEDVFSTYLYTGNGSTQTITNGIDLSTKGGLVWLKNRSANSAYTEAHGLFDTARGVRNALFSNLTNAQTQVGASAGVTAFNTTGFTTVNNADPGSGWNNTDITYASWTFRKQAKFFDVVTYTGNGSDGRSISHSLGGTVGSIILKRTDTATNWMVWHRGINGGNGSANLNLTSAASIPDNGDYWGVRGTATYVAPTSSTFTVSDLLNANGGTYVAYLFAHDAGGFGASGSDNVISCGSYNGGDSVNLGYEPQWVLIKRTDTTSFWSIFDNMRGTPVAPTTGDNNPVLRPNLTNPEATISTYGISPNATGFKAGSYSEVGIGGGTYIYIAIRRGPMRTPTSGTSVFRPTYLYQYDINGNASSGNGIHGYLGNVSDAYIQLYLSGSASNALARTRLTGANYLVTSSTAAEVSGTTNFWDNNVASGFVTANSVNNTISTLNFRRAPGFFDVVCYSASGSSYSSISVNHNLGVAPELYIVKPRTDNNSYSYWIVGSPLLGNTYNLVLQTNGAKVNNNFFTSTAPTSSIINVQNEMNTSGNTYVAYLFASCPGVSKVGSYTGTGTTKQIDCGFTGGARFVLIKRTDSTGDWYVWDSARGIVAGNDPYLLLNSTAAEVTNTDYVDTYSAGFEISSTAPAAINANGGTFIFLAIA